MRDKDAQLMMEAMQKANEADNPFAGKPLDVESANRILSEFGFVPGEPDRGGVHWRRDTGDGMVDDTAFVDSIGNPEGRGGPVPPGVLVRITHDNNGKDSYEFNFGQNSENELRSVLTPKAPPAQAQPSGPAATSDPDPGPGPERQSQSPHRDATGLKPRL